MQVENNKVVTIDYTLTNPEGEVLDTSKGKEPLSYLQGAGGIIPGLEKALEGKTDGEQLHVTLPPTEAYGEKDEGLVQDVPKEMFGGAEKIEPGMQFQAKTEAGDRVVTIVDVHDETVKVDANHPLAGVPLNFDLNIVDVRDATPEELAHGHAHNA